jgi:hypothetical protein
MLPFKHPTQEIANRVIHKQSQNGHVEGWGRHITYLE